jgi:hypothetical protein
MRRVLFLQTLLQHGLSQDDCPTQHVLLGIVVKLVGMHVQL